MYSCWTELFKRELIIYIEMDLALNNLQRLICHKTKPNQTKPIYVSLSLLFGPSVCLSIYFFLFISIYPSNGQNCDIVVRVYVH